MPKILPDIQNKILTIAERHFKDYGFERTDMREIATESNAAVGTIYLHYQNKEELYLKVIRNSWNKTLEKIQVIAQKTIPAEELLSEIVLLLIKEMTNRKSHESLWLEIGSFHHHKFTQETVIDHFSGFRDPITSILGGLIQRMAIENGKSIDESTCSQLGSFAFIMTVDICMQDSKNAVEQVDLITTMLAAYLKQQ